MEEEKVVTLNKKHSIIKLYLEGKNKSTIARELKITRDTVRKYINEYEAYEQALKAAGSEEERETIIIKANEKPTYNVGNRKRYKVTDEIVDRLRMMIETNKALKQKGQRKLIRKKIDMYETLVEEGYDISYRTVCHIVKQMIDEPKEAFVRQILSPGEMAEFDWGEVSLQIDDIAPS